jgi:DNA-binding transcriptional LysR family regulator
MEVSMETKWLEDFVSLAETHSFSRSAELRHVTQPAFSRRIQSLEAWLGTELIDRSAYPTSLTSAGEVFYEQAVEMLGLINNTRAMLQGNRPGAQGVVDFATPHTLSLTYMPQWLNSLEGGFGRFKTRLIALNVHDAVMTLVEGGCDLLLCYHQPRQPVQLDTGRYDMLTMGTERLRPYSRCNKDGQPVFPFPGTQQQPVPFLSYTTNAYLGRMVELILSDTKKTLYLDKYYENDLAESLKMMAIEGHGVAFLPESAVYKELRDKQLVRADTDSGNWEVCMEIRLYRERPTAQRPGKAIVSRLWDYLVQMQARNETWQPVTYGSN